MESKVSSALIALNIPFESTRNAFDVSILQRYRLMHRVTEAIDSLPVDVRFQFTREKGRSNLARTPGNSLNGWTVPGDEVPSDSPVPVYVSTRTYVVNSAGLSRLNPIPGIQRIVVKLGYRIVCLEYNYSIA